MSAFEFTETARTDLRRIEREQAMKILLALTRFRDTGEGDVKRLTGSADLRLRGNTAYQGRNQDHQKRTEHWTYHRPPLGEKRNNLVEVHDSGILYPNESACPASKRDDLTPLHCISYFPIESRYNVGRIL